MRSSEAAGKASQLGVDAGVFAGKTNGQGERGQRAWPMNANEWANGSIGGRSQAKGGAHLECAALNCPAHRRPPMDQRGPARARCQRGVREEAKTPAGLSRGMLEENIGGRPRHAKASSETSVRVERATF